MVDHKKIIKTGLVGYGYVGQTFHAPLIASIKGLELAAVVSGHPEKVKKDWPDVTVYTKAEDLFHNSDIDLIVLATPNDTHMPLAKEALSLGKHVVVDKPFTLTLAEARILAKIASQKERLLSVFQNRRWDSDFLGIKQAIEAQRVGQISQFESHFDRYRPAVRERWREEAIPGGGLWYDLAPHMVDQALQLFGLPDSVQTSFATQRQGAKITDWVHVILAYGEKRIILQGSMLAAGGTARFTLHGDKGSLIKRLPDQQEAQLRAGMKPGAAGWGEDPDDIHFWDGEGNTTHWPVPAGDQRGYYQAIYEALTGSAPNPVTPAEAIAVMAVIEAAIHSDALGQRVKLDLTEDERKAFSH